MAFFANKFIFCGPTYQIINLWSVRLILIIGKLGISIIHKFPFHGTLISLISGGCYIENNGHFYVAPNEIPIFFVGRFLPWHSRRMRWLNRKIELINIRFLNKYLIFTGLFWCIAYNIHTFLGVLKLQILVIHRAISHNSNIVVGKNLN